MGDTRLPERPLISATGLAADLAAREEAGNPVRVCVIGAGEIHRVVPPAEPGFLAGLDPAERAVGEHDESDRQTEPRHAGNCVGRCGRGRSRRKDPVVAGQNPWHSVFAYRSPGKGAGRLPSVAVGEL